MIDDRWLIKVGVCSTFKKNISVLVDPLQFLRFISVKIVLKNYNKIVKVYDLRLQRNGD